MLHLLNQSHYDRAAIKDVLAPILSKVPLTREAPEQVRSVLLKPNFVMPAPRNDASTTHPEFYMAIAELMLERGLQVGIGESPAIGTCRQALRAHGVWKECLERDIAVVEFKRSKQYDGVTDLDHYRKLTIAAELDQWDALINLPKLKTHQQFTFTAATKNLYGCVAGKRKFIRHNLCRNDPQRFARMLIANAQHSGCCLHVCDAIDAMHVRGPRGGKPFPLGRIIVADQHLEHDWLACRMINLEPSSTPLFATLDAEAMLRIEKACQATMDSPEFRCEQRFVHAKQLHISFSPWAVVRSGYRRIRHSLTAASN